MDNAKGRAKETMGALSGDENLEREGKADQAGARIKEKLEAGKDKIEDVVDKVKDKLTDKK